MGSETVNRSEFMKINSKLLQFSDFVGVSYYGFLNPGLDSYTGNPAMQPKDVLTSFAKLAPEKPFAICETGSPAQDLLLESLGNYRLESNEQYQADFVRLLLNDCQKLNAEFVTWFLPRDYDQGYEFLKKINLILGIQQVCLWLN